MSHRKEKGGEGGRGGGRKRSVANDRASLHTKRSGSDDHGERSRSVSEDISAATDVLSRGCLAPLPSSSLRCDTM